MAIDMRPGFHFSDYGNLLSSTKFVGVELRIACAARSGAFHLSAKDCLQDRRVGNFEDRQVMKYWLPEH